MKTLFKAVSCLLVCMTGAVAAEDKPFNLSIVPESRSANSSSISLARDSKREFYVVLTNTSDQAQPVFEWWNSWGYQNISFELTLPSGKSAKVSVRSHDFTRNFPSTYVIPPKGHQVFKIVLNDSWEGKPDFGAPGQTKIKLTAIYEVLATKESREEKVWTGRIASESINTVVNHW